MADKGTPLLFNDSNNIYASLCVSTSIDTKTAELNLFTKSNKIDISVISGLSSFISSIYLFIIFEK